MGVEGVFADCDRDAVDIARDRHDERRFSLEAIGAFQNTFSFSWLSWLCTASLPVGIFVIDIAAYLHDHSNVVVHVLADVAHEARS